MACTQTEFENKINGIFPNIFFSLEVDLLQKVVVWALNTQAYCGLSQVRKSVISDYIWYDGVVIKDTNGLFAIPNYTGVLSGGGGTGVYTFPPGQTVSVRMVGGGGAGGTAPYSVSGTGGQGAIIVESYIAGEPKKKTWKCECGATSIGSNSHSSWCKKED